MPGLRRIKIIDSHTGGEPTRVVISGGPDLGSDALANRVERFRNEHDDFRSTVVKKGADNILRFNAKATAMKYAELYDSMSRGRDQG